MKRYLPLATALLLMGCAATKKESAPLFPQYNFKELEERANRAKEQAGKSREELSLMNGALLETRARLDALEEDMAEVSPTRVEQLEMHLALLTEAYRDLYETVSAIRVLPQIRYAPKKPVKPQGFSISTSTTELLGGEASVLYNKGLESYRGSFFEQTIQTMESFVAKYPSHQLAGSANYWRGMALTRLGRHDDALTAFGKAEATSGSTVKDGALFRSAQAYMHLNENDPALKMLGKLLSRYPGTRYRAAAIREQKRLLGISSPIDDSEEVPSVVVPPVDTVSK